MIGRFPPDISIIILVPFLAIGLCVLLNKTAFLSRVNPQVALHAQDAAAFREPVDLGGRVLRALSRYLHDRGKIEHVGTGTLLTSTTTIEILHAARYLDDSDHALCQRYHASLHPVPSNAPPTQPVLSLQTNRGTVFFQTNGQLALEQSTADPSP